MRVPITHTAQGSREADRIHAESVGTLTVFWPQLEAYESVMYGTRIHDGQNYRLHFTCGSGVIKTSFLVWGNLIDISRYVVCKLGLQVLRYT